MVTNKDTKVLQEKKNRDILKNEEALQVLQSILDGGSTAEVFVGKYGIVIREIKRKTKYTK